MQLLQVIKDTTMVVDGYERHTWQCQGCHEVEQRMVFVRQTTPIENVPVVPTHSQTPAVKLCGGEWIQAIAKLRSKQDELKAREKDREDAKRMSERHARFDRDWDNFVPARASRVLQSAPASRSRAR